MHLESIVEHDIMHFIDHQYSSRELHQYSETSVDLIKSSHYICDAYKLP